MISLDAAGTEGDERPALCVVTFLKRVVEQLNQ